MTQLETLYQTIQNLKKLGFKVSNDLLEEASRVEEEIIKAEIIPALAKTISPVISQIQREIILIVEYIPNEPEPLSVRITRRRNLTQPLDLPETKDDKKDAERKTFTIPTHTKSRRTNLEVKFVDGKTIFNRYAYETLLEVIKKVGIEKVLNLKITCRGIDLLSKTRDDFYSQHEIEKGLFVITQTSTQEKKEQIEEIASRANISMTVEII